MRHALTLLGLFALTLAWSAQSRAATFYTVEMSAPRLQAVTSTGLVLSIGPLGRSVRDVDLAMFGNHLYAIDSQVGRVDLLEISQITGAATLLGTLSEAGQTVLSAESLTVRNGQLWVGYSFQAGGGSSRLGALNLNGTINPATAADTNMDLDALVANPIDWRGIDVNNPAAGTTTFFGGVPPSFTPLQTFPNTAAQINDLDYDAGQLWGIAFASGSTGGRLIRLDQSNGAVLESAIFSDTGTYTNLSAIVIPEPGLSVMAICALLIVRRRRDQ